MIKNNIINNNLLLEEQYIKLNKTAKQIAKENNCGLI